MRIAYLEIRNLDSHERKALSYWIGENVIQHGFGQEKQARETYTLIKIVVIIMIIHSL